MNFKILVTGHRSGQLKFVEISTALPTRVLDIATFFSELLANSNWKYKNQINQNSIAN